MKEYEIAKDMTQNRSVWHMKTRAGPLLHGDGKNNNHIRR